VSSFLDKISAPAPPTSVTGSAIEEAIPFERVFREHVPFVWRVLRRLGVGEADVDDVCQEVFLVVHRRRGDFEGRSSLRTWIYGICVRAASEHRRQPHRRREALAETPPEGSMPAPHDDDLERRRAIELLDRALDQLDDDKRVIYVLYEIEQLPMSEIADTVACPLQTAYSRLHAARRLIEAILRRTYAERGAK
jgi:RNA polymerase sigma-70 factor (ECF subfamily)